MIQAISWFTLVKTQRTSKSTSMAASLIKDTLEDFGSHTTHVVELVNQISF